MIRGYYEEVNLLDVWQKHYESEQATRERAAEEKQGGEKRGSQRINRPEVNKLIAKYAPLEELRVAGGWNSPQGARQYMETRNLLEDWRAGRDRIREEAKLEKAAAEEAAREERAAEQAKQEQEKIESAEREEVAQELARLKKEIIDAETEARQEYARRKTAAANATAKKTEKEKTIAEAKATLQNAGRRIKQVEKAIEQGPPEDYAPEPKPKGPEKPATPIIYAIAPTIRGNLQTTPRTEPRTTPTPSSEYTPLKPRKTPEYVPPQIKPNPKTPRILKIDELVSEGLPLKAMGILYEEATGKTMDIGPIHSYLKKTDQHETWKEATQTRKEEKKEEN